MRFFQLNSLGFRQQRASPRSNPSLRSPQAGHQQQQQHPHRARDANEEQQGWPGVSSQDVAHVQGGAAGEDVQLNGNRHPETPKPLMTITGSSKKGGDGHTGSG